MKKRNVKAFLDDLVHDSKIYRSIHETSFGKWSKQENRIEEALRALMLFKVRQQTPCVLSLVRAYRTGKIRKRHLEDSLIAIEKFHFLFTAITSQRSSGGISAMYASLARRISEATDSHEIVRIINDMKDKLRKRIPSVDEVQALFPEHIYTYNFTKERKLLKYILVCFDRHVNTSTTIDYEKMTIEHLIPQSSISATGYKDEIVGQIGNLIIVPDDINFKLKDKSFTEKKALLQAEGASIPLEISEAEEWNKEKIETRTRKLVNQAYTEVWRI